MAQTTTTVSTTSKDLLARLLAGENLTVEHNPQARTAMFDTRDRVLTLPTWDNMSDSLYDMLIGHEIGHALYTPWTERDEAAEGIAAAFDIGGKGNVEVAMDYLNVVEDARIERLVQDKLPGLRRDFFNAYKEMIDRDFFGLKGTNINDLPLLDRINIHFKLGSQCPQQIIFTPAEQVFVDRIAAAKSFDEVTVIASELFSYCGNTRNDTERKQHLAAAMVPGKPGEDGDDSESVSSQPSNDQAKSDSSGNGNSGEDNGDDSDPGEDQSSIGFDPCQTMTQVPARSLTQKAFDQSMNQHRGNTRSVSYGVLDTPNLDNIVWDYKNVARDMESYRNEVLSGADSPVKTSRLHDLKSSEQAYRSVMISFMAESAPIVSDMVKQFEMRKAADRAKRTSIARSGVIDTVRMMSYKFSEDIFRRNAVVADGKSHGLVMYIDWSSSMSPILMDTVKQLVILTLFCRKVNIPFEVYAFTSCPVNHSIASSGANTSGPSFNRKDFWTENKLGKATPASFSAFMLLNFLSSRMTGNEWKTGIDNMFRLAYAASFYSSYLIPSQYYLGSTPLDECIVAAMDMVPQFRAANKLQIVNTIFLTDGQSSGNNLPYSDSFYKTKGYIIDPVTRKTYEASIGSYNSTETLLRIFRDRTKTNAIGFYLLCNKRLDGQKASWQEHSVTNEKAMQEAIRTWDSLGFAEALPGNGGYSHRFLISATDMNVSADNKALNNISVGATVNQVTKALLKDAKNKNKSRVMLNRFIDIIAR